MFGMGIWVLVAESSLSSFGMQNLKQNLQLGQLIIG